MDDFKARILLLIGLLVIGGIFFAILYGKEGYDREQCVKHGGQVVVKANTGYRCVPSFSCPWTCKLP